MDIFRNIYINKIIKYHLELFNYHQSIQFNNYKSYKSYQYKEYINQIIIYYDLNKELEYYFNKLPKDITTKIELISTSGHQGRVSKNYKQLVIPEGVDEFTFGSVLCEHNIDNIVLPSSLKVLVLNDGQLYSKELFQFLPRGDNLKQLTISSSSFQKEIKVGDLPNGLLQIKLPIDYNQTINAGVLPSSLVHFEIQYGIRVSLYVHSFQLNVFPHGLKSLLIGMEVNQIINKDVIPSTVTTLKLYSVNQDISSIIPSNCTTLYTSSNQLLSTIPNSITRLIYSINDFHNEPNLVVKLLLDTSSIPNSVRVLALSRNQELIGQTRLPDSITNLSIRYINQFIFNHLLPNNGSLKTLQLFNCPNNLVFNENHQSIIELDISPIINNYSTIPASLKKLSFNSSQILIQQLDSTPLNLDIFPFLSVLSFNSMDVIPHSYPPQLKALSVQDQFVIDKLPSTLLVLQLTNCKDFQVNDQFLNSLPSLQHLILIDCSRFKIQNPSQVSNLSIYLEPESYNSLKLDYTFGNYDEHYCLLDSLFNYSKVILYFKLDIFSTLIKSNQIK